METVDRIHHICLTVSSENWRETWPKEMAFITEFLGMNAYYCATEEFDFETSKWGIEVGMGLGPQEVESYYDDGTPRLDYFFFVAGEDMSSTACMIDLIVFVTNPGQLSHAHPNMHTMGLRSFTVLVDNLDALYQRGIESGYEFLSEPVDADWGDLGQVRFVVVKDVMGNAIELVQTSDVAPGEGKVKRIYSTNQNTRDIDWALDFYRDGCGMTVEAIVEHSGDEFSQSFAVPNDARATTYYLKGTNPEAKTYFSLTAWEKPTLEKQELEPLHTPSYYRQWFWIEGNKDNVWSLWNKMAPKMPSIGAEPFSYNSMRPWSEATMSFFNDNDGVLQEFANQVCGVPNEWKGLGVLVDDPEFGKNFEPKTKW